MVLSDRLVSFKRLYRWLNLSLVQQGLWPLVILIAGAPNSSPDGLTRYWYLARLAGPMAAALLAGVYLWQRPVSEPSPTPEEVPLGAAIDHPLARQVRFGLIGIALMVAVARLAVGPFESAARVELLGLADVAAYQLIHFGVVVRSYSDRVQGLAMAVVLFGCSWGLRNVAMTALAPGGHSLVLAFAGGLLVGLAVGAASRGLYRWPGGRLTAAAAQWLVVYLIVAFV